MSNPKPPVTGKQPNPNTPKYIQAFTLKIVQCQACEFMAQSPTIEVYPQIENMILKAEAVHKAAKPLCLVDKLIILFDSCLVKSNLLLAPNLFSDNSHNN